MVLSLLFGRKYAQSQIVSDNAGTITFDTMVSEEHKFTSRVTYFPVERGTIVSDHIINQPDVIILSGLISDTPLNIFFPSDRSTTAFNQLLELHYRRTPVKVITGIKVYENMAIVSIDVPRTIATGQTLTFNIELQRIYYIDNVDVRLNVGNQFEGTVDNTPRSIVADNSNYPIIQNDPPFSLKDQASSPVNQGVQSLAPIRPSILPNVIQNDNAIAGAL